MSLNITIVTSENSWMRPRIEEYVQFLMMKDHVARLVFSADEIAKGDLAFFLSLEEIVSSDVLQRNKNNLVVHQSALPKGKGMSPLTWQILEGENEIPITLFEACEDLDAGEIYYQELMNFDGTELLEELRERQATTVFRLCTQFIDNYPEVLSLARKQYGEESSYRKRSLGDSELDINKSIKEQFDLLRVVDNEHYPAFFIHRGYRYNLYIEKYK